MTHDMTDNEEFPEVSGDYHLSNESSSVAVAIVGRGLLELPEELYHVMGTFKTENMGIEKIVANIVRRPQIRHLVVCGREEFGHYPGDALLALCANGVDESRRIVGTRSPLPFLCHTPPEAIDRFREQVQAHDLVHPKEVDEIVAYDPAYEFEDTRREELVAKLEEIAALGSPPLGEEPIYYGGQIICGDGGNLGSAMNKVADRIVSTMLTLPYEKLATHAGVAVVSERDQLLLDPVEGRISAVPSLELALRMRNYLAGGE